MEIKPKEVIRGGGKLKGVATWGERKIKGREGSLGDLS